MHKITLAFLNLAVYSKLNNNEEGYMDENKRIIGPGGVSFPVKVLWKKEVWDKAEEIDPNDEFYWYSLATGWAIAHGMKIEDAIEFGYNYPTFD